ncbi:DUF4290 domain-containing protein [Candidatus Shikimatogenerans bostrichidophilus]|uniref:DUF4290 domain-containing protein n=1 Tax=Candidatus Shikimatogenerans bostrichidophilus TaxID=2943807 RepID=UPI002965FC47
MEYNTKTNKIVFSQYGRNIQILIDETLNISKKTKRIKIYIYILKIMKDNNLIINNIDIYKRKLWDQLYLLTNNKLKEYPFKNKKPIYFLNKKKKYIKLNYPKQIKQYKYYGKIIQKFIKKIIKIKNKYKYIYNIANIMKNNNINNIKLKYSTILKDIKLISKGKIDLI